MKGAYVCMQEEKEISYIKNSKVADSGGKIIFENPTLCSQLLRDYSGLEMLKDVKPEDIEDVTERFIPMFTEERDADVIKKVHLNNEDIFIALIEHKSGVDYNVIMQILRYMVYIWEDYEHQQEKIHQGISHTKAFKYPPVLPIVYYEGKDEWDATMTLTGRVLLDNAFHEFIPNFSYLLISLNKYGKTELIDKKNGLSLVMLINSIKNAEEFKNLNLPDDYLKTLFENSSSDVLNVIAKVIAVVLRKQNVPEDEIQKLIDQIKERKHMALFDDWEGFDVQKERQIGEQIGIKKGEKIGEKNGIKKGVEIGEKNGAEKQNIKLICRILAQGWNTSKISDLLGIDADYVEKVSEIVSNNQLNDDVDAIFNELYKEKEKV